MAEYGEWGAERKRADFVAIGVKPFSVLSYHNRFFTQTRDAFVQGAYYPALLSACALGERTLNHLVLDLRDDYADTPEHAAVAADRAFSNWRLMIATLEAWQVLDQEVVDLFRTLSRLRNRAVHFNPATYVSARDDALAAITCLRDIVEKQFGAFGRSAGTFRVRSERASSGMRSRWTRSSESSSPRAPFMSAPCIRCG
ncbi:MULTISPECIES: hypothetical protein [unclassified Methylobacterium]|uniref:hypothetical protein n=1 Tax=unclassified Methylobacterium TaxID=2615210 RepID=UPI0011C1F8B0|nr:MULTISPECIES: hypothetical protein [unclassified Methylobacterium]MCJ2140400.1 hypothetical protein [Methylobacterium sp. E-066]QEE38795.1 hypothetical protein FVA80_07275 [Methylobacterium sp. WL1]TXN57419.1 hypothetical protein FV241_11465 [Methylobacterium sp. WL2]